MFSRRHYRAIAEVLRANQPEQPAPYQFRSTQTLLKIRGDHHRCIVDQIANLFARDNPQFDWDKFVEAVTRSDS